MDCFGKAYLFLIERTLARYGYTAEIKITRKSEEEEKASEQSETWQRRRNCYNEYRKGAATSGQP